MIIPWTGEMATGVAAAAGVAVEVSPGVAARSDKGVAVKVGGGVLVAVGVGVKVSKRDKGWVAEAVAVGVGMGVAVEVEVGVGVAVARETSVTSKFMITAGWVGVGASEASGHPPEQANKDKARKVNRPGSLPPFKQTRM